MSRYTQTIKSIIMQNKQAGEDVQSITDLYTIANRCLFDTAPMNVISSEYRQRLITGFTLHFFNEEIGLETLTLFKIGLTDKIYNNAEYINAIFEHLDKQIFADYSTKVVEGSTHDEIADTGTIENTGTVTDAKSGNDTVKHTGTEANAHTGNVTHTDEGYEENTKSGTETHTYNNVKDASVDSGSDTVVNDEHYADTVENDGSNKSNTGSYSLDTPQNNIGNLRSKNGAAYNAEGKGIAAIADGTSMSYMSAASLGDGTTVEHSEQTTRHDDGGLYGEDSTVTTEYGRHNDRTRTGSETDSFTNRKDRHDVDMSHVDTYAETNTRTPNLQDKTEYGSSSTRTDNLTMEKDLSTVKDGTNDSTETSNNLNLEMIYRSMPLLNKVWEIFDDLFMSIY